MKRVFIGVALLMLGLGVQARHVRAGEAGFEKTIAYDIPLQPLGTALKTYVLLSGVQVLYETALTEGRQSRELKGQFAPEAALELLLDGTGLLGRRTAPNVFVVTMAPPKQAVASVHPDGRFLAALQAEMMMALCSTTETRPGGYKVGIDIWISADGVIDRTALIGSTGEPSRDQAVNRVLRGVAIGVLPPRGLKQPLFVTISGRPPRDSGDCSAPGAL